MSQLSQVELNELANRIRQVIHGDDDLMCEVMPSQVVVISFAIAQVLINDGYTRTERKKT